MTCKKCPFALLCYMDHFIGCPHGKDKFIYFCPICKRFIYVLYSPAVTKVYTFNCEKRKDVGAPVYWKVGASFDNKYVIDPITKREIYTSKCNKCLQRDISHTFPTIIWMDL